jgi:dephospho-CoA kinase
VLDIPLLYETRGTGRCDYVLVVSAPPRLQRERVMRRSGMTDRRFGEILAAQLPDSEKRRRADFVVPTALSKAATFRRLQAIVDDLRYGRTLRHNRRALARHRR